MIHKGELPLFTICICVRDGEEFIDRCIGPILEDSKRYEVPIVVIDHLSKDRTPELLKIWELKSNGRMKILRFEGVGLAAARNYAWLQTATPWFAFIDADCKIQQGWTEAVIEEINFHKNDQKTAGFGGNNTVPVDRGSIYRAYRIFLSTYVGGHSSILNRTTDKRRPIDHIPTLNAAFLREAIQKVDGFNPSFVRVGEDIDLSYRLRDAGYVLWSCPSMFVEHALRPSLKSWIKNMYLYGRGRLFFFKHHPQSLQIKFFAPAILVFTYFASICLAVSNSSAKFSLLGLIVIHVTFIGVAIAPESMRQRESIAIWFLALTMVWITHIMYGIGFLREIFGSTSNFKKL